jgi:hypothetical protein
VPRAKRPRSLLEKDLIPEGAYPFCKSFLLTCFVDEGLDSLRKALTHYLTKDSKLLLHREIKERVSRLAPFLTLDSDPYLIVDDSGKLFWMVDAYTATNRHPYSQPVEVGDDSVNYIRNSVKVTVDAYNGAPTFTCSMKRTRF